MGEKISIYSTCTYTYIWMHLYIVHTKINVKKVNFNSLPQLLTAAWSSAKTAYTLFWWVIVVVFRVGGVKSDYHHKTHTHTHKGVENAAWQRNVAAEVPMFFLYFFSINIFLFLQNFKRVKWNCVSPPIHMYIHIATHGYDT